MGHAAVVDLGSGERIFTQTVHREAPGLARFGVFPDPEIAWMRGPPGTAAPWFLAYRGGAFAFGAADAERGLRLELAAVPTREPLLHGEGGHSPQVGRGERPSYYYSHPRLEVTGSLGLGEKMAEVTGTAWMDREFGSAWLAPDQTGWDWFGLNLGDGRDLMLYLLRRRDGSLSYADGTLRDADAGPGRRVRNAGVQVLGTWMPPDLESDPGSSRAYPAGWRLRLPGEGLDLEVYPLLAAQENRRPSGQSGPDIPYWEGAVRIEANGGPFGQGFVELTGVPGRRRVRRAGPGYNRNSAQCAARERKHHDGRPAVHFPMAPCVRRGHLDRPPLLLQLRQRSDDRQARRGHEGEGRAGVDAARPLLVPVGRRLDLD